MRVLCELVDELLHLDVELDGAEVERRRFVAVRLQEGLVRQPHRPDPGGRLVHGDRVAEGDDGPESKPRRLFFMQPCNTNDWVMK